MPQTCINALMCNFYTSGSVIFTLPEKKSKGGFYPDSWGQPEAQSELKMIVKDSI